MVMTPQIRAEFLGATQKAFGDLEYGVIGGTALAEYGNRQSTSDVHVMVPNDVVDVVEEHLLQHGMVRTADGGIGLDITSDRALGQIYKTPGSQNRVMPAEYLLNLKAYSYLTRIGPDMQQKKASDAQDIIYLVNYMKKSKARPDRKECRWVVDHDFWTAFCSSYQGAEEGFQALGLQRDATPNSSNHGTRNNSMDRSSGNDHK